MKRKFMMLSILISGPKQPRDDIGIYLEPLIDDLKLLWERGEQCYDAYNEELFNLRSVLLWTINDFLAYGNLSGCSVKGYKACPICEDNTSSIRLKYGKKWHTLGIENFYHIIILFVVKRNRLMILDKAPNEESPNDALTQALGTPEYDGRVRGVGGFITPTVYFHQAKPRKSNKVDTTQQIIDENEALRKRIRELEQKVQNIPTSKHGSCSKSKVQKKEKVLENVVKEKKGIATSVPPVSLTSKKKVVEEEKVKEEEVIATTPMTKNEVNVKVKSSKPMKKEVEVTSEPSNLPIQLKYILRYAERVMVDGSSFSFQLPLELFGISRKSYVLREDVIDFCNMQKVKTLSMVAKEKAPDEGFGKKSEEDFPYNVFVCSLLELAP
ncbi:hypothetical protein IC582_011061 [Cucumis melo]